MTYEIKHNEANTTITMKALDLRLCSWLLVTGHSSYGHQLTAAVLSPLQQFVKLTRCW